MIGIKIKNSLWEKALLSLLGKRAEVFQPLKNYQAILTDSPFNAPDLKGIDPNCLVGIGNNSFKYRLKIPFEIKELESLLIQMAPNYENDFFIWNSKHRKLKNKKDKKEISLTEKETAIIAFLSSSPTHTATKEELLKNVWQYTFGTETHTVETTVYSLRQKLKPYADNLIIPVSKGYKIV